MEESGRPRRGAPLFRLGADMKYGLRSSLCALAVFAALFVATTALALEPPTMQQVAKYQADGTLQERIAAASALGNDKVDPSLVSSFRSRVLAEQSGIVLPFGLWAPPPAWQNGLATTGTQKILAVCIDFPDYPATIPMSKMQTLMDRPDNPQNTLDANYPVESLRAFYQRSSYGQLDLRTDTYGWYRSPVPRSEIPTTAAALDQLVSDALAVYDAQGVDFSQYDNDHNGTIDYLMVYWTGPPGEWASFWWGSFYSGWVGTAPVLDGVSPSAFSWQQASSTGQRTAIHETGHALGLPDLYDYDDKVGPNGGVGGFDMMASGNDHNAFSKWMLGWSTPTFVNSGQSSVPLRTAASSGDSLVVMPGASAANMFSEFFMVENRRPSGNDSLMFKNPGLTVWHVDARLSGSDFAWNNSFTSHKYIAVEQADGLHQIEATPTPGVFDAADTWTAGKRFAHLTMPASTRYDSSNPDVTLDSIAFAGTTATLRATVGSMSFGSLLGTVSSSGGGAIAGATVSVPGYAAVDASIDGTYSVPGLDPGTYDVTYLKPRYTRKHQSVTISSGTATTRDVALVPAPPGPFYVSVAGSDETGDGSIGYPFATVQHAIDVAVYGEEVYVLAGIFNEDVTMKDGVSLWGTGATIYGTGSGPTITASGIGATTTISGFTISGGNGVWGGGVSCTNSSLVIRGNTITGNTASDGGGISSTDSSPTITGNTISDNTGGGISSSDSSPTITGNTISDNPGGGVSSTDSTLTITDNTITGNTSADRGGAIDFVDSSLTITGNTIAGNSSSLFGGGINGSGSSATVVGNEISKNMASGGYGGGISFYNSSATIDDNRITGNTAAQYGGGGIYLSESATTTVTSNDISGNTASIYGGGAILCANFSPSKVPSVTIRDNTITGNNSSGYGGGINCFNSSPTITNNDISGNSAINYGGGGVYCTNSASTITSNTITGNSASNYGGGGILCANFSASAIASNTISGNTSSNYGGGGIACYDFSSPSIVNNTITSNAASVWGGGGIYIGRNSSPNIINDTITQNTAVNGGGIYAQNVSPSPTIVNCIVWGNGDDLYRCSATYSDISSVGDTTGLGNISAGPSFVSTGTGDFHLNNNSPCIDAATSTVAPDFDKDGNARPHGGGDDIGAYECVLPYTLKYSAGPNGSLTGTSPQTVVWGASGTAVSAIPNIGYHFLDWTDGKITTPRTDTNVRADVDVTANFAINTYTLKYAASSEGTISAGVASQTVNYNGSGSSVTASATTPGYHFTSWSDGSTQNPRTDTNVTANVNVTANFAINTYTLKYAAGSGGTISSGVTSQTVNYGTSGTAVTASGGTGYHFVSWSDGSTQNPRTDTNVMANVNVTANFSINTYTLKYAAGANGTISSGVTSQTVNYNESGSSVTASATTPGYHFTSWSDGSTQNPRTDTNVMANVNVTANFAINTYALRYAAGANGTISSGVTSQTVNYNESGSSVTASATTPGYRFLRWSDGSRQNLRTDTNVMADVDVTASFATIGPVIYVERWGSDTTGDGSMSYPFATVQRAIDAAVSGNQVRIGVGSFSGNIKMKSGVSIYGSGPLSTTLTGVDTEPIITVEDIAASTTIASLEVTGGASGIYVDNSSPIITGNIIKETSGTVLAGINYAGDSILCVNSSSPLITYNTIDGTDGKATGIKCILSSPTISYNTITDANASGIICAFFSAPTIRYNTITGNSAAVGGGGGILCEDSSSPIISDNSITGNSSEKGYGGGIYCSNLSSPAINHNIITGNTASTYGGGGIYCSNSSPTITRNTIGDNRGGNYGGGAILCANLSTPVIEDNAIARNTSGGYGGGIYCSNSAPRITKNTIEGNTSSSFGGGGIGCSGSSPVIIDNAITGNSASNYGGGGILCYDSSSATIASNTISANTSSNYGGGGICTYENSSPSIVNNVITGNSASVWGGGGIYSGLRATPWIINNTITGNTAVTGGGVYAKDPSFRPTIVNCIVWDNGADDLYGCSATYSDIGTAGDAVGTGNISAGPSFVETATGDFHLNNDSPCIDAATSTGAPLTDKDGNVRPHNGGWDMGAYECVLPFTLTYSGGTSGSIEGTSPQTVDYGEDGTEVIAVSGPHYDFLVWSDGVATATRRDLNVTHNINVTAEFVLESYTVTYTAGPGGSIDGISPQTVGWGESGTMVTAVPDGAYRFVKWSDNVVTASRTDVDVTANKTVTAQFALNVYSLTYNAGTGGTINGNVSQSVTHGGSGTSVTASATIAGYNFVNWSDGSTANPRTDTNVQGNIDVTASFASGTPGTYLTVYRFYNAKQAVHFYTASEVEMQNIKDTLADTYHFEGEAYKINTANPANNKPLYRFFNKTTGAHFYTASAAEMQNIKDNLSAIYNFEGTAYDVCTSPGGSTPVYRFYNMKQGVHFYTVSAVEMQNTKDKLSATYKFEGPGFWLAP